MKGFVRNVLFNAFSIFFLSQLIGGVKVTEDYQLIFSRNRFDNPMVFLKPILNILSLPFKHYYACLFSFVTNIIIFYLLTVMFRASPLLLLLSRGFLTQRFIYSQHLL